MTSFLHYPPPPPIPNIDVTSVAERDKMKVWG